MVGGRGGWTMASPTNGRSLGRLHSHSTSASRTMAAPRGTLSLLLVLSLKMNLMSALCSTLRPRRDLVKPLRLLLQVKEGGGGGVGDRPS